METIKTERIEVRVTTEEKRKIAKALKLSGDRTVSSFIMRIINPVMDNLIQKSETIFKSERDWEIFFNAIDNPPEPTEYLKKAAKRQRSMKGAFH